MICANLMTQNDNLSYLIDDCEFWKKKIDMLDMFNFYNENWNLCWIEYPSLRTKILIKKFLMKRQPNLSYFWTWDCRDYVWPQDPKRVELTSRAQECVFIGYVINDEAYRFYDLNVKRCWFLCKYLSLK